ncbi:MAG: FadD3 family acyl-CoA ligase [Acidimicrobiales bacterium]
MGGTFVTTRADLRWGSIPELGRDAVRRFGSAEAVVDGDARLSWTELGSRVDSAARAFLAAGIERGDRVAIWAPNTWEWVVALLGLQSAGAVLVPLNTRFKGAEAGFILRRSATRLLLTTEGFLGHDYVSMLHGEDLPGLDRIVVLRSSEPPPGTASWDEFVSAGTASDQTEVDRRVAGLGPHDRSDILFTSGTTGRPKGVVQTHGQTLRAFESWAAVVGLGQRDRYLIVNPFFHAFGYKAGIVACLLTGAVMVPLPVFDVPAVMRAIAAEAITMLPGPPSLYQAILNHPDRPTLDATTLRLAVTGAAAIPVSLVEQMRSDLGFETVVTGYGLTEACGIATMCRHDDDAKTIATTSGRAIADVEVRCVDDAGHERPHGSPGEIVVRGYNVMDGYLDEPEQTAEIIDTDGWLHTGDIGVMDERGYVAITDRKKDMFIVGGFNAYPAEIESLLTDHPGVAQVAVVGVPDDRLGEVGVAFVVAAKGRAVDPDEVMVWARTAMANYKVPRRVEVVDALPLNASGKVLKFELRERATAGEQT